MGEGGGSLDGGEQTVVAKMLLRSARMAAAEAKTGKRIPAGYQLGKEAKQVREEPRVVFRLPAEQREAG